MLFLEVITILIDVEFCEVLHSTLPRLILDVVKRAFEVLSKCHVLLDGRWRWANLAQREFRLVNNYRVGSLHKNRIDAVIDRHIGRQVSWVANHAIKDGSSLHVDDSASGCHRVGPSWEGILLTCCDNSWARDSNTQVGTSISLEVFLGQILCQRVSVWEASGLHDLGLLFVDVVRACRKEAVDPFLPVLVPNAREGHKLFWKVSA